MRTLLLLVVAGCSAEKPAPVGPDFGPEEISGKLDSAQAPASFNAISFGQILSTSFTGKSQYRAFHFDGAKGQKVSLWVDGLRGLDTVAYLYKASSDKPTGSPLASNDDTTVDSWTLASAHNDFSSSIVGFVLPETRRYALVATTYFGESGHADVMVEAPGCGGLAGIGCPDGQYCELPADMCAARDLAGTCREKPQVCFEIYKPVCGCDGKTYSNDCVRQGAGALLGHAGPCG